MEKTMDIDGKVMDSAAARSVRELCVSRSRKEHVRVWREIYQDVRRQWMEAEHGRTGGTNSRK